MKRTLTLLSAITVTASPALTLISLLRQNQKTLINSKTYTVSTNDHPGKSDAGWNDFLYTDKQANNFDKVIRHNQNLSKGDNYDVKVNTPRIKEKYNFIPLRWNIGGGLFLDKSKNTYINTPVVNAKKGLFGSFNYIHSLDKNLQFQPSYLVKGNKNNIRHFVKKQKGTDITEEYNLKNFSYINYSSPTQSHFSSDLDLTPSYVGADDFTYQHNKGVILSKSKVFINNILNSFLNIWYFDNWVKSYQFNFTSDEYYNLGLYDKLRSYIDNDTHHCGFFNKLFLHISILHNYLVKKMVDKVIQEDVKKFKVPEWSSVATEIGGELLDQTILALGLDFGPLGFLLALGVDSVLLGLQSAKEKHDVHVKVPTADKKKESINFYSNYLTYTYMKSIFDNLLGTPQGFKKGDYSKPIANFFHTYHKLPSQIHLKDFNIFLSVNKFFNKLESYFHDYTPKAKTHYHQIFNNSFNPSSLQTYLQLKVNLSKPLGNIQKLFDIITKEYNEGYILGYDWSDSNASKDKDEILEQLIESIPNLDNLKNYENKISFEGTLPISKSSGFTKIKIIYDNKISAYIKIGY